MRWFFPVSSTDSSGSSVSTARLLWSILAVYSSLSLAIPGPIQAPLKRPTEPILRPEWSLPPGTGSDTLSFSFRHVLHHGGERYPGLLRRKDIRSSDHVWVEAEDSQPQPPPTFSVRTRHHPIQRLADRRREVMEEYLLMNRNGVGKSFSEDVWIMEDVKQPNITDKKTVINLARMTANAYVELPGTEEWMDIGKKYNTSIDFGWDGDGIRGHVFVDSTNSTVIISLKGTSPAIFDGPDTTTNDKINDNLLFSCCCARVGYFWKTVCDCYSGTAYHCGKTCLKDALLQENTYYRASLNLYYEVSHMFPNSQIWVVGHSLGGAVSSLLGMTYGLPVVAFEAPGEALAASRIGLPFPPGEKYASSVRGTYHFGNTADPIFMGTCNGMSSACSIAGYAMETKCHAGSQCVYDTVTDLGWRIGLGYHRIQLMIKDVLEKYDNVPTCQVDRNCTDCYLWKFENRNHTTTTTTTTTKPTTTTTKPTTTTTKPTTTTTKPTTTTTKPTTTTTTCKTKGFWGCLDDPTTGTTTTCTSYNWFWKCVDKGTTRTTTATTTPMTNSTTCTHWGWLGRCLDPTNSTTTTVAPTTTANDCTHKGLLGGFGGCVDPTDKPAPSQTAPTTPEPTEPPSDPW